MKIIMIIQFGAVLAGLPAGAAEIALLLRAELPRVGPVAPARASAARRRRVLGALPLVRPLRPAPGLLPVGGVRRALGAGARPEAAVGAQRRGRAARARGLEAGRGVDVVEEVVEALDDPAPKGVVLSG